MLTKVIVNVSRGRGVLEAVLHGRGQLIYLGEEKVCLVDWRWGETMQINYKMNFITFLKMLPFHRYFSAIFYKQYQKTLDFRFSKFFQSISTSQPFKFMHIFIHQIKDADFRSYCSWLCCCLLNDEALPCRKRSR